MKLYPRLALTILSLILLQALFTGFNMSRTIRNSNLEDARVELELETDFIINNFNSWKRHLWKQLIMIRNYAENRDPAELTEEELNTLLTSTGIDAVIVNGRNFGFTIESINNSPEFVLPDSHELHNTFNHPSIRLFQIKGQFYMVGTILPEGLNTPVDVYLIKHINDYFLRNLVLDTHGQILFHTATDYLGGDREVQKIAFRHISPETAYTQMYGLTDQNRSFNLAQIKMGDVLNISGASDVYLSILLSNEPYNKRIQSIERTVLTVSLLTLVITALLSLLFTRGITRPVATLASAMGHIRQGRYDIQLNSSGSSEIGVLLRGFNGMAARLHHDQIKIEKSLDEITFLNEFNEEVIHSIRDALAVVNDDYEIEKSNSAFDRLAGARYESLIDFSAHAFDETLIHAVSSILSGEQEEWNGRLRNRDEGLFEVKIYPVHREFHIHSDRKMCVLLMEDISARTAYEEKINQAEKLSSISMLSAGIAHEVNNPLTSIVTNIQNLIYDEKDPEKLESLRLVEDESRRIAQIIRDLNDFTSREQDSGGICSPLRTAEEVKRLIQHARRPDGSRIPPIRIHTAARDKVQDVRISRGELMQLLINLLQNAVHATEDNSPIEIILQEKEEDGLITVRDRGCGIPEEIQNRIFDPFYTTKANGEGTGLGLSVVYGIMQKYKGSVEVKSASGSGTSVTLRIPFHRGEEL
ncbi:MAG: ATP-binding protein [Spirochaetales bacterium]|nr:ATP-binding protein [Spirochaetales bacterium]